MDPSDADLDGVPTLTDKLESLAATQQGDALAPASRERDAQLLAALEEARWQADLPDGTLGATAGLADRTIERMSRGGADDPARPEAWRLLDVVRRPQLLTRIVQDELVDPWAKRIERLLDGSDFTFWRLFEQRSEAYGHKALFRLPGRRGEGSRGVPWETVRSRVDRIARALMAHLDRHGETRVAILSENRLEMALLDLACLSAGIVNVLVPANAAADHVGYILNHAEAELVVVSGAGQLKKVLSVRDSLPLLEKIVVFDSGAAIEGAVPFARLLSGARQVSRERLAERRAAVRVGDLATVMYTSGTTGDPKGICFSQRNIVFKRFARALALPEIGEDDVFICYLPLCHTFGRFLELCGCVFWGATYCFAESTSPVVLADQIRRERATVMISIPLKWIQLYDLVRQEVDIEGAPADEVSAATRRVVGHLRWGLSAAGYLSPDIFRFFQAQGVEVMSGFGMTEATGGITMTPPGRYEEDSLGRALPGIELSLADDGELLIRGPYVTIGHLDPPDGKPSFDEDGWFHTGDLMRMDDRGFIKLVDRKKEIYKNVKGETIAPQRVENLFRSFDSVASVFLVGDHRPYNTALIFPNPEFEEVDFGQLDPADLKKYFRSLVVLANGFVAPFERIVDFAVIDRDFSAGEGERTAKGTYKRRVIEQNFAEIIGGLYHRSSVQVGGAEIVFPNWFFQTKGLTADDLGVHEDRVTISGTDASLTIRQLAPHEVQVGACVYRTPGRFLNLSDLLRAPSLWLGNEELTAFAPRSGRQRNLRGRPGAQVSWLRRATESVVTDDDVARGRELIQATVDGHAYVQSLDDLDLAARLLSTSDPSLGELAVQVFEDSLDLDDQLLAGSALRVLRRGLQSDSLTVLQRTFQVLALAERPELFVQTLESFLNTPGAVLDEQTVAVLAKRVMAPERIGAFVVAAEQRCASGGDNDPSGVALLRFLAAYGAAHPGDYRSLRGFLARMALIPGAPGVAARAVEARANLERGFHRWLGGTSRVAVDPDTGLEYGWPDVLVFEDELRGARPDAAIDPEVKRRLRAAVEQTALVRESLFLFGGLLVGLNDVPPGGISVSHLATHDGKSVVRMTVQVRARGRFELAVNVNLTVPPEQVREETDWLVVCCETRDRGPVAEGFGGYWPEHGLWTEEFVPGTTLDEAMDELAQTRHGLARLEATWPYLAWTALAAYVDFWDRTWRRTIVARPSPASVIVSPHDYQAGARLMSLSPLEPATTTAAMLHGMWEHFIDPVETAWPQLRGRAGWETVLCALLEVVGDSEGKEILAGLVSDSGELPEDAREVLRDFASRVLRDGFVPRALHFAIVRFRSWHRINPEATREARAATLRDLVDTYGLEQLAARCPEARVRLFRETVLAGSSEALLETLDGIGREVRAGLLEPGEVGAAVAGRCGHLRSGPDEDYFLARLSFPHLRPGDLAGYVAAESSRGGGRIEMMVTFEDRKGRPFQVRHALNPREVGRLHRQFIESRFLIRFREEHRFLVAVNDLGHLLGGLAYEVNDEDRTAHLEKIVVAPRCQRLGIGNALMQELFYRLGAAGIRAVTTGYFRPAYFQSLGFRVERQHAGLVRSLEDSVTRS